MDTAGERDSLTPQQIQVAVWGLGYFFPYLAGVTQARLRNVTVVDGLAAGHAPQLVLPPEKQPEKKMIFSFFILSAESNNIYNKKIFNPLFTASH